MSLGAPRLEPWLGLEGWGTVIGGGRRPRPSRPAWPGVRCRRAQARAAQADRRSAAPRLRSDPRDRGADPRRLRAEPGRGLSDPDHARGYGPDRGAAGRRRAQAQFAVTQRRRGASRREGRGGRSFVRAARRILGSDQRKAGGAPIKRAVGNLLSALWHRVTRDGVNDETHARVASILDEAAQKIERLT